MTTTMDGTQIETVPVSRLVVGDAIRFKHDGPWLTAQWISHGCCWARVIWKGQGEACQLPEGAFVERMVRS